MVTGNNIVDRSTRYCFGGGFAIHADQTEDQHLRRAFKLKGKEGEGALARDKGKLITKQMSVAGNL